MARRSITASREPTTSGDDSFLDIVANIVGILIILVLVAGVRAGRSAAVARPDPEALEAQRQVAQLRRTADSLQRDVLQLAAQETQLTAQVNLTRNERAQLAVLEADLRHQFDVLQQQLDERQQRELDLLRRRQIAEDELAQLRSEIDRLTSATKEKEVVKLESLPTPISRLVDGNEEHFQLRAGRITYIPLEELLARLKQDAQRQISKLQQAREVTSIVGPVGGFRMRYMLERVDISPREQMATGRGGSYARLVEWNLVPVSNLLGETLAEALEPASEFHAVVDNLDPRTTTVTLWTYPDSFTEYRRLRRELFELGFQTAGRPLPHEVPIGGSPEGSKSAGQ